MFSTSFWVIARRDDVLTDPVVLRFALLIWPGWAVGLLFGLLLSLPDAITKAYALILVVGAVGGLIIGGILHGWHAKA